jgi:protein SCO1/2
MARVLLASLVLVISACCSRTASSSAPPKQYALHGEVLRLDARHKLATIRHEKIEGWMEAMTMDFPVHEQTEFEKLKPGLRIQATVFVREGDFEFWIGGISPQPAP